MSREKVYVKVKHNKETENFFAFNCTGYGWVYKEELNNNRVDIQCEDDYEGYRGWSTNIENIEVCEVQKECTYRV